MNRLVNCAGAACAAAMVSSVLAGPGSWTIVATYEIPESASGLAWDGTWLYCGIYGVDGGRIFRIDPADGSSTLLFTGPQEDAFGLTFDGTHLWTTDHPGLTSEPAIAMQLDLGGTLVGQFDLPDHYMSGIAWDGGNFYAVRYFPDPGFIYELDGSGTVLDGYAGPDNQPWDLAVENGNLWIADYFGDALYRIDAATGGLLESHPSEGVDPAGIVWDGSFLWYCDNGDGFSTDRLYKIDLSGAGTPVIDIPDAAHDFGAVTVGDAPTWNMAVDNTGAAPLEISAVDFGANPDLSCPASFPVVVPARGSTSLPIVFAPSGFGSLDAVASVLSSDPVSPSSPVTLTGDGVLPGPAIALSALAHDYGAVRAGATTRWFLEMTNQGDEALTVTAIGSDDSHFYVDQGVTLPLVLPTLATAPVGLWFNPDGPGAFSGTISIDSNDPGFTAIDTVALSGSGDDSPQPIGQVLWSFTIDAGFDNSPKAMAAIGDVSGDGRPDVIVCSEDDHIRCFNGNGHGVGDVLWDNDFGLGYVYDQKGIAIVPDISRDGVEDVVVGTAGGQRVIRTLSGRTGAILWTHDTAEYGTGGWVYQVDAGHDYNGDGTLDVLASTGDDATDTGPKRIYCLNGLSGVPIWEHPLGGPGFGVIGVEDFTGDGLPDVVAGASNASETIGRAVGINGQTGLEDWTFVVGGSSVWGLTPLIDINADTVPDVAIADFISGTVHGLDATNGSQRYIASGFGIITRIEALDDVNGDGHPDFVPVHSGDFARLVSGRQGATLWTTPLADNASTAARIADVSGDGVNDVVVGTLFTGNFTYFLDGVDGSILHSAAYPTPVDAITTIPDVTGDGSWEMIAGGRNGLVRCISGGTAVTPPCPGDTDGSGQVDIDDIVNVVLCFGTSGVDCPTPGDDTDVNQDGTSGGVVDIDDIVTVVLAFGGCPGT